jgi:triosephosphate isomerase
MKKIVVANWKMNPQTLAEAERIFSLVSKGVKNIKGAEVVICPPFIYLSQLRKVKCGLPMGAQDCFFEEKGAFTGEVSPVMLKSIGCQYVIIGHSERRKWQGETDSVINKKVKAALAGGLKVILCIEKESQLVPDLKGVDDFGNLLIAFEPVSAIGTGKPYDVLSAGKVNNLIRKRIKKGTPVLYGGSVNSQNAEDYIKKAGFDGFLIGGASLVPEEFIKIIKIAQ